MGEPVVLVLFTFVVLFLLYASFRAARHFLDPRFTAITPVIICSITLTLVLTSICLIPIDVYVSQSPLRSKSLSESVLGMYYFIFALLLLSLFVVIPLAYFYYGAPERMPDNLKFKYALRQSAASSFLLGLLIVVGMLIEIVRFQGVTDPHGILLMFESRQFLGSSLEVCIGMIYLSGMLGIMFYCGFGLAAMPIVSFIKRMDNNLPPDDPHFMGRQEIYEERSLNNANKQALWRKYRLTGKRMNRAQRESYQEMADRDRLLHARALKLAPSHKISAFDKLLTKYGCVKLSIGATLMSISWLIVMSVGLTAIDRYGQCESYMTCTTGYLMKENSMGNPMDWVLLQLSRVFPFDYIALATVVFYFVVSAVYAMTSVGVRFLVVVMYPLRAKKSYPQALLLATANVIFVSFAISCQLAWVAPQYTSFGLQTYKTAAGTVLPCTLLMSTTREEPATTTERPQKKASDVMKEAHSPPSAGTSVKTPLHAGKAGWGEASSAKGEFERLVMLDLSREIMFAKPDPNFHSQKKIPSQETKGKPAKSEKNSCRPTQVSMIINGIMARYPFFGTMFQHTSVGFVFTFFLFSLVSIARNPGKKWIPDSDDEEESDEEEEAVAFLGGGRDDAGMYAIEDEFM